MSSCVRPVDTTQLSFGRCTQAGRDRLLALRCQSDAFIRYSRYHISFLDSMGTEARVRRHRTSQCRQLLSLRPVCRRCQRCCGGRQCLPPTHLRRHLVRLPLRDVHLPMSWRRRGDWDLVCGLGLIWRRLLHRTTGAAHTTHRRRNPHTLLDIQTPFPPERTRTDPRGGQVRAAAHTSSSSESTPRRSSLAPAQYALSSARVEVVPMANTGPCSPCRCFLSASSRSCQHRCGSRLV